jgi:hypothetical protein
MIWAFAVFAVWRASIMITEDEGPFSCFMWLREHIDYSQRTWIGRGLNCSWCVSWWASLVMALWLWFFGYLALPIVPVVWFGLSGGSVLLSTIGAWMALRRR